MHPMKPTVSLSILLLVLAGCGGSSADPDSNAPAYQALSSTTPGTSSFSGSMVRSRASDGTSEVTRTTGTLDHQSRAIVLNDGKYEFVDLDGPKGNIASDSASGRLDLKPFVTAGTYDYLIPVYESYAADGTLYDLLGVVGITTRAEDVPGTGTASFTGDAVATLITTSAGYEFKDGLATLMADFGSGRINVSLTDFTVTDSTTGLAAVAPIDQVLIDGMTISGNHFAGGTITTNMGGVAVDVIGTGVTADAAGDFFGLDSASGNPDEAGGVVLMTGSDGSLQGTFVAD